MNKKLTETVTNTPPSFCARGSTVLEQRFSALRFCSILLAVLGCLALLNPATAQNRMNVDADGDGLIEISTVDELHNAGHDMTGASYRAARYAPPNSSGCPTADNPYDPDGVPDSGDEIEACYGYELVADLDFDPDGDGPDIDDPYWNDGDGWFPIGTPYRPFMAVFDGNGHTISNLFIDRHNIDGLGLFGHVQGGEIRNLGLINAKLIGQDDIGGLVGELVGSTITASYAEAAVSGDRGVGGLVGTSLDGSHIITSYAVAETLLVAKESASDDQGVGGLVGINEGAIIASYAIATVSGDADVGGLVGRAGSESTIKASYAVSAVSGASEGIGNLVGINDGLITASYFDADIAGIVPESSASSAKTTSDLQMPIGAADIYATWDDEDLDGDGSADNPWNFGAGNQYPGLVLQLAGNECSDAPPGISVEKTDTGTHCIHRPSAFVLGFRLENDDGDSNIDHVTHQSSPTFTGKTLPNYEIRIVSGGAQVTGTADEQGDFDVQIELTEGIHQFEIFVRPSGQDDEIGPFNTLGITMLPLPDANGNGLFEIDSLEDLFNIRYSSDDIRYRAFATDVGSIAGCPTADDPYDPDDVPDSGDEIKACYGYELIADLDFDVDGDGPDLDDPYWRDGQGWVPITGFMGTLEGNGHTIANLFINRSIDNVGLFGSMLAGGQIRNLKLVNVNVTGDDNDNVGGLVGVSRGDIITSYVEGTVSGRDNIGGLAGRARGDGDGITESSAVVTISGRNSIGGLAGRNDGDITMSYAEATVLGNGVYAGGLVGYNLAIITESYALATVSGRDQVGGLVGYNDSATDNNGNITKSYVVATVSGSGEDIGGFVGRHFRNASSIIANYSVAVVSGNNKVGGFMGSRRNGTVDDNYALATVSGNSQVGGFVGQNERGGGLNSFFNTDLTAQTNADGVTTSQMQMPMGATGIYAGWNAAPWDFGDHEQYPGLVLSKLTGGGCPTALANIEIEETADSCIHRPLSTPPGFALDFRLRPDDDRGRSNTDGITNVSSPRLMGRVLFKGMAAASSAIRIVSLTTGAQVSAMTNSSGEFMDSDGVGLEEGLNRFAVDVRLEEGGFKRLSGELAITLISEFSPTDVRGSYLIPRIDAPYTDIDDLPTDGPVFLEGMALSAEVFSEIDPLVPRDNPARQPGGRDPFIFSDLEFIYITTSQFSIQYHSAGTNDTGGTFRETLKLINANERLNADGSINTDGPINTDLLSARNSATCYEDRIVEAGASSVAFGSGFDAVPLCDLSKVDDGDYLMEVTLTEVADIAGNIGTASFTASLNKLSIDRTAPTIAVIEDDAGENVTAWASDPFLSMVENRDREFTLYSFEYQKHQTSNSVAATAPETCKTGLDSGALANLAAYANQALSLSDLAENEVYCFVATDRTGNRGAVSSASAIRPTPTPTALRLKLRIFLESALP